MFFLLARASSRVTNTRLEAWAPTVSKFLFWKKTSVKNELKAHLKMRHDDEGQDLGYYSLYDAVMGGEYDAWATAGKFLLDEMSDTQKQKLIDAGAHIANTGVLIPSRAYRIDRNKTQQLKRDGSNFFALAEEIAWNT